MPTAADAALPTQPRDTYTFRCSSTPQPQTPQPHTLQVILNIASLRWANQIFEPTWNAQQPVFGVRPPASATARHVHGSSQQPAALARA